MLGNRTTVLCLSNNRLYFLLKYFIFFKKTGRKRQIKSKKLSHVQRATSNSLIMYVLYSLNHLHNNFSHSILTVITTSFAVGSLRKNILFLNEANLLLTHFSGKIAEISPQKKGKGRLNFSANCEVANLFIT